MKNANWKDIAELIGISAIVASLVFVGLQIRQDRNVAQADAWLQHVETQVNLAQVIGEHADVWSKGLDGEKLSDADQMTFNQIAYAVEQKYTGAVARSNLGIRVGSANGVAIAYAEEIFMYSGLRQYFESGLARKSRRGRLKSSFFSTVKEHLEELDSGKVEPPSRSGYAF